jgi:GNAT superfamily N-acetyltransferase
MHIREAQPSDLENIAQLHAKSWRIAYRGILSDAFLDGDLVADRRALWQARFDKPAAQQNILIAEIDGALVGFACSFGSHDEKWGSLLENLHVAPGLKGSGIGAQLVAHVAQWCARTQAADGLHLWMLAANTAARGFYLRLGAREVEQSVWDAPDGNSHAEVRFAWPRLAALTDAALPTTPSKSQRNF